MRRRRAAPSPISPEASNVIVEGSGTGILIARSLMAIVAGQSLNSSSVVPAGRFKMPLEPRSCGGLCPVTAEPEGEFVQAVL